MLRFHGSKAKKDFELIGYNSRLDALQAAMLRDLPAAPRRLERGTPRGRGAATRSSGSARSRSCRPTSPGHVYHMYCVRSFERDRLAAALAEAQIGFASYYQPPLHLQPALRYLGYSEGDFPETEKAARENLCLPMWGGISEEQQAEVVAVLRRASSLVQA